jgi:hypothetical protein
MTVIAGVCLFNGIILLSESPRRGKPDVRANLARTSAVRCDSGMSARKWRRSTDKSLIAQQRRDALNVVA